MNSECYLPLSGQQGEGLNALVDRCYVTELDKSKWYPNEAGYAYSYTLGLMHRYVVSLRGDNIEGLIVDHINGDRLDNRSSNLRIVTSKGNAKNKHNDPVHEKLVGVRKGDQMFETVHKNVVFFRHNDERLCALCYDSIVWYCYGKGKRLNDNKSTEPLPLSYWNLDGDSLKFLRKIKESYTDYIGVKKVKNGWKATITVDLGTFETKEEAAKAYNRALVAVKKNPKPEEFNKL
jgi:hypothetical protein